MTLFSEADWQDCTCISRPLLDDEIGLQYHNRTLTIGRVLAARGNTEVVPQGATSTRGTILRRIGASALTVVLLVGELAHVLRSEEHTSELQSLMRISYAVFCLKKKTFLSNIQTKPD